MEKNLVGHYIVKVFRKLDNDLYLDFEEEFQTIGEVSHFIDDIPGEREIFIYSIIDCISQKIVITE